jgi:hypothetical protein
MEDSVAEKAEASNHKKEDKSDSEKKDTTIHIVKLEFIEAEPNDTVEEKNEKETETINPIPG